MADRAENFNMKFCLSSFGRKYKKKKKILKETKTFKFTLHQFPHNTYFKAMIAT